MQMGQSTIESRNRGNSTGEMCHFELAKDRRDCSSSGREDFLCKDADRARGNSFTPAWEVASPVAILRNAL